MFRLPLPPTAEIRKQIARLFAVAVAAGLGVAAVSNLMDKVPGGPALVTAVLTAATALNLLASGARAVAPKTNVADIIKLGVILLVVWILAAHGSRLLDRDDNPNTYLVVLVVLTVIFAAVLRAVGPYLVRGKTAADSLRWAGGCAAFLLCAWLRVDAESEYNCVFVPVAAANLLLALAVGGHFSRYRLADPLLTHGQAAAGEAARRRMYGLTPWTRAAAAAAAVVLAPSVLPCAWGFWRRLNPDLPGGDADGLFVALAGALAAAPVLCLALPSSARLAFQAHAVWVAYDEEGAAGPMVFRFRGFLARAERRRFLYGLVLTADMMAARLLGRAFDLEVGRFGALEGVIYAAFFFAPLLAPFGLMVLLHRGAFLKIESQIAKGADHA